ncbi:MAG: D-2-hydroxyacid dehydrogenase [Gammaproteobacteria bacterium]|nr:D-2-hydroxyacid dehydrogenase [Gammaproteobacteria bacterium]
MKAVFLDYATMGPGLDLEPMRRVLPDLEIFGATDDSQIGERIRDAEFVFANKFRLTPELLGYAAKLRFIGLTATGTDNVDLEAAQQHDIAVCNIRAYCTQSVVEHVFGVMLMLTHSLGRYDKSVRAGEWQKADDFCMLTHPVRELSAMTLGIVGYGELGQGVARIAKAFGMQVLVSVRPGSSEQGDDRVPFKRVLEQADAISLHCPLNENTYHLFGADEFHQMKRGSFLINTARGALIDSAALVDALQIGQLAGAGIDVLAEEPPVHGDPVLDYAGDNLVITPHIAWATNEARQNAIDELVANVEAFISGKERSRVV